MKAEFFCLVVECPYFCYFGTFWDDESKIKISALTIDGSNIYKHLFPIDGSMKLSSQGTHLDTPSRPFRHVGATAQPHPN
jgi:hypothetical protein